MAMGNLPQRAIFYIFFAQTTRDAGASGRRRVID
jgi:hypothetical protein